MSLALGALCPPRALLYSEHQFLFFWLGSLDFSPFVMSAKFPLLPPNAEAHRIGPGWIQWRSIGKEFNIIPVGLVHCTAPHPTGFYHLMLGSSCQCMHIKQCIALSNGKNTNCAETRNAFPSQSWSESKRDVERYDLLRRQWQLKPVKLLNQVRSQSFIGSTGLLPKSRQCFIKGSFPLNRTFLECVNLCISCVCMFVWLFVWFFICLLFYLFDAFLWLLHLFVSCVCCLILLLARNIHRDNISGYP